MVSLRRGRAVARKGHRQGRRLERGEIFELAAEI
jgi:hypothetical protein